MSSLEEGKDLDQGEYLNMKAMELEKMLDMIIDGN